MVNGGGQQLTTPSNTTTNRKNIHFKNLEQMNTATENLWKITVTQKDNSDFSVRFSAKNPKRTKIYKNAFGYLYQKNDTARSVSCERELCPVCSSDNTRMDLDFPATMINCDNCGSEWNTQDELTFNARD